MINRPQCCGLWRIGLTAIFMAVGGVSLAQQDPLESEIEPTSVPSLVEPMSPVDEPVENRVEPAGEDDMVPAEAFAPPPGFDLKKPAAEEGEAEVESAGVAGSPIATVPAPRSSASQVTIQTATEPKDMPPAPPAMSAEEEEAMTRHNSGAPASGYPQPVLLEQETLVIRPGINHVMAVSRSHLNRIVTPISSPRVRTTSNAQIDVRGSALFVQPQDDRPIAMYVRREGTEDPEFLLTLVPKQIPPRETRLIMSEEDLSRFSAAGSAQDWEEKGDYKTTITKLLRAIALGEVPPGYSMRRHTTNDPAVFCADPVLKLTPVQIIEGHNLSVTVAAGKNISGSDIEVNEVQCQLPAVAAVSTYPTPYLRPGQSTEVYIVNRRVNAGPAARDRPPVIDPDYLR